MATAATEALSKAGDWLQTGAWVARGRDVIERWLEAERDQLALWLPVAIGGGVTAWFLLPSAREWAAAGLAALALAALAAAFWRGGRAGAVVLGGALAFALGVGLVWWRAERVAAPVLARAAIGEVTGTIVRVEPRPAQGVTRVRLRDMVWPADVALPAPTTIRVNIADADLPRGLSVGARLTTRVRLMPPAPASVPGAYDFAQVAWFDGLGATGRAFAPVRVTGGNAASDGLRARLSRHIEARLAGSAGGIASALATGDTGAITLEDSDAMRRAGLAHLLSVSGLHITAVVGVVMWLAMRVLALSPRLALTGRVPVLAGACAAAAAIGYTLLTGSEVPTIRSCVAALLVLAAMAWGREAMTLRLVAAGALVVLLAWPESLAGPSFQLSFAAVTAIIALHEAAALKRWFGKREEAWWRRVARELASLLLTGLVVEIALMPIAAYHFHKAGIYGAGANIVAIPLTTFVVMPLEAVALAFDAVGAGGPVWVVTGWSLAMLLWLAKLVAHAPGAVAALPAMPGGAFAMMVAGGLMLALLRTRVRFAGLALAIVGGAWALATPAPDLIVTGDGRHLAIRGADGALAILRDRAGDYTRDVLAVAAGLDGEPVLLSERADARCNADLCWIERQTGERRWRVLATRSAYLLSARELAPLCQRADVVVSERRVPRTCHARAMTLDRAALAKSGGVAITFATGRVATVRSPGDAHPWIVAADAGLLRHRGDKDRSWQRRRSAPRLGRSDGRDQPLGLSGANRSISPSR